MQGRNKRIAILVAVLIIGGASVRYLISSAHPVSESGSTASQKTDRLSPHSAIADELKSKTGDNYDKLFITMMSQHHAGAVAMAGYVVNNAEHPELRALGQNIITAQTKEIADMRAWAASWGYDYILPDQKKADLEASSLKPLSGGALDKQFLGEMTSHHRSALAMARLSSQRAQHTEINALSAAILSSQSEELMLMGDLAHKWGYSFNSTNTHGADASHM